MKVKDIHVGNFYTLRDGTVVKVFAMAGWKCIQTYDQSGKCRYVTSRDLKMTHVCKVCKESHQFLYRTGDEYIHAECNER